VELSDPTTKKRKTGYFRKRVWVDLSFLCIALALGYTVRDHLSLPRLLNDKKKWEARPKLDLAAAPPARWQLGESGLQPCLFLVPPSELKQPVESGSVDDCRLLVPDGSRWDLFEVCLGWGRVLPVATDVYVAGAMPLAFTRTYRTLDDWSYRTKIYLMDVYDPFLWGTRNPYTYLEWDLPDSLRIPYKRISPGTGFEDAVYETEAHIPRIFGGSRIAWNGYGWDVSLADGTTYLSPEAYSASRPLQGSLVGIFDRDGNEVRLKRESNGNLVRIESPGGGWIRITYSENRIIRVENNSGDKVDYDYDRSNRLRRTTNSQGITRDYAYDDQNRLLKVVDSKAGPLLEVAYDSGGKIVEATLGGTSSYYFNYEQDERGYVRQANVIGPQSDVTRVRIADNNYTVEKLPRDKMH
jgi:YD repeat-containing protein